MKKFLSLFVALAMVLSLFAGVGARSAKAAVVGDVNGNGTVGMDDALLLAQSIVGIATLTTAQRLAADVNGDGFITMADTLVTAQIVVGVTTPPVTTVTVTVGSPTMNLLVGANGTIVAIPTPTDATVTYASGTPAVATVGATTGVVTAVAAGTATITVTAAKTGYTSGTAIVAVTVTAPILVVTLTATPATTSVQVGLTDQITAAAVPTDATITYVSSDLTKATVSTTGLVTGVAVGTANITVTAAKTGYTSGTATVAVTVTALSPATIATPAIAGVTAPVTGATPTATIAATAEYTAAVSWSGSPATFAAATIYTATITLTPTAGYTLTGVAANFFTVVGATATNAADSGVVSAIFPATVLPAPVLLSPVNDAVLSTLTPTLSWSVVPGATKYEVRIWVAPTSATNLVDQVIAGTSYTVPAGLLTSGGWYGWSVCAGNSLGWSVWATVSVSGTEYSPSFTVTAVVAGYSYSNPAPLNTVQTVTGQSPSAYGQTYTAEMSVEEIIRGDAAWNQLQAANMFNSPAPEGYEYILARIYFKVLDVTAGQAFNLNHTIIDLISSDGKEYGSTFGIVTPDPQLDGYLYKGASSEGWDAFIVKKGDLSPRLAFGRNYDGTGGIWFKAY